MRRAVACVCFTTSVVTPADTRCQRICQFVSRDLQFCVTRYVLTIPIVGIVVVSGSHPVDGQKVADVPRCLLAEHVSIQPRLESFLPSLVGSTQSTSVLHVRIRVFVSQRPGVKVSHHDRCSALMLTGLVSRYGRTEERRSSGPHPSHEHPGVSEMLCSCAVRKRQPGQSALFFDHVILPRRELVRAFHRKLLAAELCQANVVRWQVLVGSCQRVGSHHWFPVHDELVRRKMPDIGMLGSLSVQHGNVPQRDSSASWIASVYLAEGRCLCGGPLIVQSFDDSQILLAEESLRLTRAEGLGMRHVVVASVAAQVRILRLAAHDTLAIRIGHEARGMSLADIRDALASPREGRAQVLLPFAALNDLIESHRCPLRTIVARVTTLSVLCKLSRLHHCDFVSFAEVPETCFAALLRMCGGAQREPIWQLQIGVELLHCQQRIGGAIEAFVVHRSMQAAEFAPTPGAWQPHAPEQATAQNDRFLYQPRCARKIALALRRIVRAPAVRQRDLHSFVVRQMNVMLLHFLDLLDVRQELL